MPRKSKYIRERDRMMEKLGVTKISEISEELLSTHLEELKDDEALTAQIYSNWKRATTRPKSRNPSSPAFGVDPEPVGNEEAEAPAPSNARPEVRVRDLGIREAIQGARGAEDEVSENQVPPAQPSPSPLMKALAAQRVRDGRLMSEMSSIAALLEALIVLVGSSLALYLYSNYGHHLWAMFSSS
jgi:hypothetical protein